jgi:hypothetical protein
MIRQVFFGLAFVAVVVLILFPTTPQAADTVPAVSDAWSQLVSAAILGLASILTAAAGYAGVLLRAWVLAKTAKIKDEKLRGDIEHAFKRLETIIGTTVVELNETVKRRCATGGRVDAVLAMDIKRKAVDAISGQMSPWLLETMQMAVPNLERYISGRIEARVVQAKGGRP